MDKIYVLIYEDYDEYYIVGTFTSKEYAVGRKENFKKHSDSATTRIYCCELNTDNIHEV